MSRSNSTGGGTGWPCRRASMRSALLDDQPNAFPLCNGVADQSRCLPWFDGADSGTLIIHMEGLHHVRNRQTDLEWRGSGLCLPIPYRWCGDCKTFACDQCFWCEAKESCKRSKGGSSRLCGIIFPFGYCILFGMNCLCQLALSPLPRQTNPSDTLSKRFGKVAGVFFLISATNFHGATPSDGISLKDNSPLPAHPP